MEDNLTLVRKGLHILLGPMANYVGQKMRIEYKNAWWEQVRKDLHNDPNLPIMGEYTELVESLDEIACFHLIDWEWTYVFKRYFPTNDSCRTWAKELVNVRNIVSHRGQRDIDQTLAERALNTMLLLCQVFDAKAAKEIDELYHEVRSRAADMVIVQKYDGLAQPASESKRGELKEGSLLQLVGTPAVEKTSQTRKVTYGGETKLYPVYKVALNLLYYNDQNDRIATWITQYEAENGSETLSGLDPVIYNGVIENFIIDSNPDAIQKTQKNIAMFGQMLPGVTLADGRIVDGNRRFTCLRRLQREKPEQVYFETVIMDYDMQADKKQIKLLELAVQHGEEKKVDYDLIDYAIGTYRDIVETKLLTVEEYAASTNETPSEVKKRIEIAGIIKEFLDYIRLPGQYHVAREYQVYSLFVELYPLLNQLNDNDRLRLKKIAFNNAMFKAEPDQRKFIRDIKGMIKSDTYKVFMDEQDRICAEVPGELDQTGIKDKSDIEKFVEANQHITNELCQAMESALQSSRQKQLKAKPADNVGKGISLLLDVDPRLFKHMDPDEKTNLKASLEEMIDIANGFIDQLKGE